MGIRFHCHHCHHELHVKDFQGGKRGRCPECQGKFRIPLSDAELSSEVDEATNQLAVAGTDQTSKAKLHGQESKPIGNNVAKQVVPRYKEVTVSGAKSSAPKAQAAKPHVPKNKAAKQHAAKAIAAKSIDSPTENEVSATQNKQTVAPKVDLAPDTQQLPRAIIDFPAGTWHVRPAAGGQYGPAPAETMGQWLIEGRVARDALVWRDDWSEWLSAEQAFSDYFVIEPTAIDSRTAISATESPGSNTAVAQPLLTTAGRSRLERKHKKRQRYIVIVSILTVLFIALLVALAVVLLRPSS